MASASREAGQVDRRDGVRHAAIVRLLDLLVKLVLHSRLQPVTGSLARTGDPILTMRAAAGGWASARDAAGCGHRRTRLLLALCRCRPPLPAAPSAREYRRGDRALRSRAERGTGRAHWPLPRPFAGITFLWFVAFAFLFVFGVRAAAAFMLVGSTIGCAPASCHGGSSLPATSAGSSSSSPVTCVELLVLILPAWVTAVSVVIPRAGELGRPDETMRGRRLNL